MEEDGKSVVYPDGHYSPTHERMDEYRMAFGQMAMFWSKLERDIGTLVEKLSGTDTNTAAAIYLPLTAESREKLCSALAKINIPEENLRNQILDFLSRFKTAREHRNRIIHSGISWINPETLAVQVYRESQRGELKQTVVPMPLQEVKDLMYKLNDLCNEMLGQICFHEDFKETFTAIRQRNAA